ncbi:hypothetical protein Tco_0795674 [Tanacetum coccineum]
MEYLGKMEKMEKRKGEDGSAEKMEVRKMMKNNKYVLKKHILHEGVAEEVIEMANDQAEALSFDKEVTDECLDDEHV